MLASLHERINWILRVHLFTPAGKNGWHSGNGKRTTVFIRVSSWVSDFISKIIFNRRVLAARLLALFINISSLGFLRPARTSDSKVCKRVLPQICSLMWLLYLIWQGEKPGRWPGCCLWLSCVEFLTNRKCKEAFYDYATWGKTGILRPPSPGPRRQPGGWKYFASRMDKIRFWDWGRCWG